MELVALYKRVIGLDIHQLLPAVNFRRNLTLRNGGGNWRRGVVRQRGVDDIGAARPPMVIVVMEDQNGGSESTTS